jgi:hypothetical protein
MPVTNPDGAPTNLHLTHSHLAGAPKLRLQAECIGYAHSPKWPEYDSQALVLRPSQRSSFARPLQKN